ETAARLVNGTAKPSSIGDSASPSTDLVNNELAVADGRGRAGRIINGAARARAACVAEAAVGGETEIRTENTIGNCKHPARIVDVATHAVAAGSHIAATAAQRHAIKRTLSQCESAARLIYATSKAVAAGAAGTSCGPLGGTRDGVTDQVQGRGPVEDRSALCGDSVLDVQVG